MPNAFVVKEHKPRLNDIVWDKYYIDRELKEVVRKTGEGEEDFVVVKKVVETKRSIKETIDAQAEDVGLENILRKFALTGDESILPKSVNADGEIVDMSQMPQDLIDANNFYAKQKELFASLPDDLVKGRSFETFMATINQAEYNAWMEAVAKANGLKIDGIKLDQKDDKKVYQKEEGDK